MWRANDSMSTQIECWGGPMRDTLMSLPFVPRIGELVQVPDRRRTSVLTFAPLVDFVGVRPGMPIYKYRVIQLTDGSLKLQYAE